MQSMKLQLSEKTNEILRIKEENEELRIQVDDFRSKEQELLEKGKKEEEKEENDKLESLLNDS